MKVRFEADSVQAVRAGTRFWPVVASLSSLMAVSLIVAAPSPAAGAPTGAGRGNAPDPTGRYIVVLKNSVARPGRLAERHAENRDARITHVYRHAIKGYAAKIPPAELSAIRKDPNVAFVEPDAVDSAASQTVPTGIERIFATANDAIGIDERDDRRVDVNVAVLDSGIAEFPDLNLVGSIDCTTGPCHAGGTDLYGHGTHVAGTIGALDNGEGVVGVAPGARLWSVKVLDANGYGKLSDLIAGVEWITATREDGDPENDIEVANESLEFRGVPSSPLFSEVLAASIEAGIVHVAAAGNEHRTVQQVPGIEPDEITVSAIEDSDGKADNGEDPLASFSDFGSVIDIAAPGDHILSTTGYDSGTSMAAAHVSGAAAILASKHEPRTRGDVESIRNTLVATGNFDWVDTSGDGIQEPLLDVSNETTFAPKYVEPTNQNWRIEGSTLAELGAWEPYESQGAFHTEFEAGSTQVVISCQTDGTGTLGLSETIALTECETKLNGATSTRCAPADTSIDLDGELKSKGRLAVLHLGSECAIGSKVELKAGPGFTMQPGPEAVEFAAQMSETTETGAGSSASVSIPSTMTMTGKYEGQKFAYAGDFESLNPDWRIEGSTLAELEAWEPYESQGAFHTEFQSGTAQVAIACQTAGTGTLGLSETIALTECETKLNGATSTRCAPADTSIDLDGELKSEDPLVVFQLGSLCALGREAELKAGPGFTMQPGPEAVEFAAQMSETTETGAGSSASVSIPSTMTMTGKYEGQKFAYAGDFESLNPDWRIEGSTLAELEAWEPYESQGAFHTEFQSGTAQVAIACQTAGTGTLGLSETIALTECETKLNGATSTRCAPADTSIDLDGELKSEDPLVVFQTGTGLCAIGREAELKAGPGFTMQPGPEAVEFAAQMSETTETGAGASASVSIPSTMTMTGKYEGSEFGYE